MHDLIETIGLLLSGHKGLLAIDESKGTCNKRFAQAGIAEDENARRDYGELIVTTPGLSECISGVILYDETIRQSRADGMPFVAILAEAGIVPGIKVDMGAKDIAGRPGETITEGLDGLRDRLREHSQLGARFAKWRAVIGLGEGLPSESCIDANAHALARYAGLCQEAGLVPIVEPEVLMQGDHAMARCGQATETVLRRVFTELVRQGVALEAMIFKPNMILPGLAASEQPTPDEVAKATLLVLRLFVPPEVPGIAFLSGEQSVELAWARLNAMNGPIASPSVVAPWALTFSYARAIQQPALQIWAGKDANRVEAQRALLHRALCNSAARRSQYSPDMEGVVH